MEEEHFFRDFNVFTNYKEVVDALKKVEGEDWFEQQKSWGEHSIDGAIKKAKKGEVVVIYGAGGDNRYVVCEDGHLELSLNCLPDLRDRYEKLGFSFTD